MASKTKEQVSDQLKLYIKDLDSGIDTQSGSVVSNAFIEPQSELFELGYADLDNVNGSFNPANWASMSDYQLEQLASTWNLERKVAIASQAIVTFYKKSVPTGIITIPAGTIVTTLRGDNSNSLTFYSTSDAVLDNTKWNATTNRYEVDVVMTCSTTGSSTNIASSTIVNTSINTIDGCINKSASYGGTDVETNEALANRIAVASQGRVLGTIAGYQSLVNEIVGITDNAIVTAGDADAIRNTYGNEVDIVIVGDSPKSVIDEVSYSEQTKIVFSQQPVTSVNFVKNVTTGVVLPASAYTFIKDTSAPTYRSSRALDRITLDESSYFTIGDTIQISYITNGLVKETQDYLDLSANKIIGSNTLVREGVVDLVNIAFTVKSNSTKSASEVETELTDAVFQYINALQLGDPIEQSDIVFFLRSTFSYVDNIVVPFSTLVIRPTTPPYFTGTASDLYPSKFHVLRCDNTSIDITVI